jgi:hypothetical protein
MISDWHTQCPAGAQPMLLLLLLLLGFTLHVHDASPHCLLAVSTDGHSAVHLVYDKCML